MKMKGPKNSGESMSFGGVTVKKDKDGNFEVPENFVEEALSHGLAPVEEKK